MVYQTIRNLLWSLRQWLTSLLWISDTTSTVELGTSTGTSDLSMPPLKRQKRVRLKTPPLKKGRVDERKPPLAPKKDKRRLVEVPAVLYIDHDYWDARMTDVLD